MPDAENPRPNPGADWLPPEIVEALRSSAVLGIRGLQQSHGLGLYEAKLAVDAYLQRHPDLSPAAPTPATSSTPVRSAGRSTGQQASLLPVSVVGVPIDPAELPGQVHPPAHYVVGRAAIGQGWHWAGDLVRHCLDTVSNPSAIAFVDEEIGSAAGDLVGLTLRVNEPLPRNALESLERRLRHDGPAGVSCRVVCAVGRDQASIHPADLQVAYFRHELSSDGWMDAPRPRFARLTHKPTGTVARSTAHRSPALNYEEALLLLASLLASVE